MTVRVSAAIQTHPARAEMADRLYLQLYAGGLDVEAVTDPAPDEFANPWRTYREALERTPDWATHRLVIQDDATLCGGFAEAVPVAVRARPERVLSFYHSSQPRENIRHIDAAVAAGEAWFPLDPRRFVPAICLCWPVDTIRDVLAWIDEQGFTDKFRSDDEILGRALRALGVRVLGSAPSLVQHEDVEPSLIGLRARGGLDKGRVAHRWLEPPGDARRLAWQAGAA